MNIGPYCFIEDQVVIGDGCQLSSSILIKKKTTIKKNCRIFHGAVIGEIPQDIKYAGEDSEVIVGNDTIIREYSTIHRGTVENKQTTIGNNCLLMAYSHVAHDCTISNHVILSNGVQIGGHVIIDEHAIIGGMTPVHQFSHIGCYSFIGGGLRVVQDIPPYILANGEPIRYSGINIVGLRRNNFKKEIKQTIKDVYSIIYKSNQNVSQSLKIIKNKIPLTNEVQIIIDFIKNSKRGIIC